MATVFIPSKYKNVVDACVSRDSEATSPIFETNVQLMIFAAFLGAYHNEYETESFDKGNEIQDRTFFNNNLEGMVYLIALHHNKNPDILRTDNESQCWQIFESYAAGGFKLLEEWIIDNPSATDVSDILINRMKIVAAQDIEEGITPSPIPAISI